MSTAFGNYFQGSASEIVDYSHRRRGEPTYDELKAERDALIARNRVLKEQNAALQSAIDALQEAAGMEV